MKTLTVEMLDDLKETIGNQIRGAPSRFQYLRYADVRVELGEGLGAYAEDGFPRQSQRDFQFSVGVRVIAGIPIAASGYEGLVLGVKDFRQFDKVLARILSNAYFRAVENARLKHAFKNRWGAFADSIIETRLAPVPVVEQIVCGAWKIDPRSVNLAHLLQYTAHISGQAKTRFPEITRITVDAQLSLDRKLFASSEGSFIDQTYACAGGNSYIFAVSGMSDPVDLSHHCGNQVGAEALFEGANSFGEDFETFTMNLAKESVALSKVPALKTSDKPVTIVVDPDFNALVAHEIVGHPSELDRAMKWETGYAGRSWFFRTPEDSAIGNQIASPLVTVFSDPTLQGAYGHYRYDDEGTPGRRVYHLQNGIYREFLNSRETAEMLGLAPNGHYLASSASVVPAIRMSQSIFAPGDRDPKDILKEVDRGWYISGHRTPAIAESRENFLISARLVYEIRNGELGQLFRDGGITSDSKEFFMSVDAVGNDCKIFPIPNCGKCQPMQSKQVGNGGPTMRARAFLAGK